MKRKTAIILLLASMLPWVLPGCIGESYPENNVAVPGTAGRTNAISFRYRQFRGGGECSLPVLLGMGWMQPEHANGLVIRSLREGQTLKPDFCDNSKSNRHIVVQFADDGARIWSNLQKQGSEEWASTRSGKANLELEMHSLLMSVCMVEVFLPPQAFDAPTQAVYDRVKRMVSAHYGIAPARLDALLCKNREFYRRAFKAESEKINHSWLIPFDCETTFAMNLAADFKREFKRKLPWHKDSYRFWGASEPYANLDEWKKWEPVWRKGGVYSAPPSPN